MKNRIVIWGLVAAAFVAAMLVWSSAYSRPRSMPEAFGMKLVDGDLWTVTENGEKLENLTSVGDVVTVFEPSANGVVLFGRSKEVPVEGPVLQELWSRDAEGKTLRETDDLVVRASMSRDGKSLIYEAADYRLELLDRTTKKLQWLPGKGTQPEISPDGSRVAFIRINDEAAGFEMPTPSLGLSVYDGQTRAITQLTGNREDYNPFWAPDGSSLYYGSVDAADGSGAGIYRIAASGGTPSLVTGENAGATSIAFTFPSERPWFSNDGTRLYYFADTGNGLFFWNVALASSSVSTTDVRDVFPDATRGEIIAITETGTTARYPID